VQPFTEAKECRLPQFNQMNAAKGNIGDRFSGSAFAPLRYGIEEEIGAVVDILMIVQVSEKDIVGNDGPLLVIQAGESVQVGKQISIEAVIFLIVVAQHFRSAGHGELEMLLCRDGEGFRVGAMFWSKDKLAILDDCINELTVISEADIHQAGKVG